jgi:hypothetical protein
MANTDGSMKIDDGGVSSGLGVPVCHPHDGALLKSDDVAKIIREGAKHWQLRRPRVTEDRSSAE